MAESTDTLRHFRSRSRHFRGFPSLSFAPEWTLSDLGGRWNLVYHPSLMLACIDLPRGTHPVVLWDCRGSLSGIRWSLLGSRGCSFHHLPLGRTLLRFWNSFRLPGLSCSLGLFEAWRGWGLSSSPSGHWAASALLLPYLCGRGTSGLECCQLIKPPIGTGPWVPPAQFPNFSQGGDGGGDGGGGAESSLFVTWNRSYFKPFTLYHVKIIFSNNRWNK